MDHTEWRDLQDSVRLPIDGHDFDLAYAAFGEGEPVTLFLHGIPTWSYLFQDAQQAVEHAVLPDFPGYGFTRKEGSSGYDRSIRVMAETVEALLDAIEVDSAQVVAHDLGGGAALRLAVHTDRVDKLVLSNAVCYDSWPVAFIHEQGLPGPAREWTRKEVAERLKTVFTEGVYDDEGATDEFVDGMLAPFLHDAHDVERLARNAIATNTNHTMELTPQLPAVDVPTLLLWGGEDVLQSTEWADRLAADLPNAETQYLDRAYHWVMQDRPDAYREALNAFLE